MSIKRFLPILILVLAIFAAAVVAFFMSGNHRSESTGSESGINDEAAADEENTELQDGTATGEENSAVSVASISETEEPIVLKRGDVVSFGHIDQNGIEGDEPIEWRILDATETEYLLLSLKCIAARNYSDDTDEPTWEESYARKYLNGEFFEGAFTEEEKNAVMVHAVDNREDLSDALFLLNQQEAELYFYSDEDRQTLTTKKAKDEGVLTGGNGNAWWRLRTNGSSQENVMQVSETGHIDTEGSAADNSAAGIRPAMWVSSAAFENGGILMRQKVCVGDEYTFGTYEQDGEESDGEEPIKWKVIAVDNGMAGLKVMLVAENAIDSRPYHNKGEEVTWEEADLRRWLHEDFYNSAFSEEEKKCIEEYETGFVTGVGEDSGSSVVKDKVKILNNAEVEHYLPLEDRIVIPSRLAVENGCVVEKDKGCWWWLRDPGSDMSRAAEVSDVGISSIESGEPGAEVGSSGHGIRPVIWIKVP